jgi:hypothetical protein
MPFSCLRVIKKASLILFYASVHCILEERLLCLFFLFYLLTDDLRGIHIYFNKLNGRLFLTLVVLICLYINEGVKVKFA